MLRQTRPGKSRQAPNRFHSGRRLPLNLSRRSLFILLLFIVPLLSSLLLVCLAVEREPLVVETAVPTVDSALRAKNLAKSVLDALNARQETVSITASEDDINALMTLVGRGEKRFAGRVFLNPGIMFVYVSVRLPANPLGRFLNLKGELLPDERGLNINLTKIGKIKFPHPLAGWLLKGVLNLGLGNNEGSQLLASVKSLALTRKTVTVSLRSVPQMKERLKHLQAVCSRLRDFSQGGGTPWDKIAVGTYYARLLDVGGSAGMASPPSLSDFIGPLFRLAEERSKDGDPVKENSAALLALSIFLGNPLFDKLTGLEMKPDLLGRSYYGHTVLLGGRNDSRLHFIISAGLKLLTDQGISSAVGEFKELLDAGKGGSGFSFVDLASDRTGIRFAEIATDPDGGARRLQELLSKNPAEMQFYPVVADLPENMPESEFKQRYGGVNDPRYNGMVREIDRRIDICPAYGRKLRH
jgi:hypothetical protein